MRDLGQLEAAVMQTLWAAEDARSVREVLEVIVYDRPLAYTTVLTVLDNLHGKGLVERRKRGRAWLYTPTSTRAEHTAALLEEVLDGAQDRGAALLHFVGALGPDEVADLRAALGEPEVNAPGRRPPRRRGR